MIKRKNHENVNKNYYLNINAKGGSDENIIKVVKK
jgi:hypothetical protein